MSGGWIPIQQIELECPFCHKMGISAQYFPPSLGAKTSRTSGAKATRFFKVQERYEGITDCPHCGKKAHEIEKALRYGVADKEKDKKVLQRLKEQGLDFSNVETKF